jgi:hypothetical protein
MLRDGELSKELDSFFVPRGTVESSPAIHRRIAEGFLPRPVRTLETCAGRNSSVPKGRQVYSPLFPAVNCRANFNRPYRDENLVKPNAYFFSA